MSQYDNCKSCQRKCEHAGKDREFVCLGGVSCKATAPVAKVPRFICDNKYLLVQMDARYILEKAGTYAEVCQASEEKPMALVALKTSSLRVRFGLRPDGQAVSNLELLEAAANPENATRLHNTAFWMIEDCKFAFGVYPTKEGRLNLMVPERSEGLAMLALAEYLMDPVNENIVQKLCPNSDESPCQTSRIRFFECEILGNEDPDVHWWICIKAVRKPTEEEASAFLHLLEDGERVTKVDELSEAEARASYCFENEDEWPIFGA